MGIEKRIVTLKVPLAFIIRDIQGGDGICGQSAYYNSDARKICRICNATPEAYESEEIDCCQLLVMEDMKQMCSNNDTANLYKLSSIKPGMHHVILIMVDLHEGF